MMRDIVELALTMSNTYFESCKKYEESKQKQIEKKKAEEQEKKKAEEQEKQKKIEEDNKIRHQIEAEEEMRKRIENKSYMLFPTIGSMEHVYHPELEICKTPIDIEQLRWPELRQVARDRYIYPIIKIILENKGTTNKRKIATFEKMLDELRDNVYNVLFIVKFAKAIGAIYSKDSNIDKLKAFLNNGEIISYKAERISNTAKALTY